MKKEGSELTAKQKAQLDAIAKLPDDRINTDDIPEATGDWSNAKRGLFYGSIKQQVTIRLDADLIAWFKSRHPDCYQISINSALREYVRTIEQDR